MSSELNLQLIVILTATIRHLMLRTFELNGSNGFMLEIFWFEKCICTSANDIFDCARVGCFGIDPV